MSATKRKPIADDGIPRGTGSYHQRANGSFEVVYRLADGGKPQYTSARNEDEARDFLRRIARFRAAGRGDYATLTCADYFPMWLAATKPRHRDLAALNTWSKDEGIVRLHLLPALGEVLLVDVTPKLLDDYRKAKEQGHLPGRYGRTGQPLGRKSLHDHFTVLRKVFAFAHTEHGLPFEVNPADRKLHKLKTPKDKMTSPFDPEQLVLYQSLVAPEYRAMALLQWAQGLRMGEVLALRIRDYDASQRLLWVRKGLQRDADADARRRSGGRMWVEGDPKTDESKRSLRVDERVHEVLAAHIESVRGPANPRELMFPTATGHHQNPTNIRSRMAYPAFCEVLLKADASEYDRQAIAAAAAQVAWLHRGADGEGKAPVSEAQRAATIAAMPVLAELLALPGTTIRHLLEVRLSDLDLDGGTLTTLAPDGTHGLTVPLDEALVALMREYLAATEPGRSAPRSDDEPAPRLFVGGKRGSKLGQHVVLRTLVTATLAHFGDEVTTTVHGLRAAYATARIEFEPNLSDARLAAALGHVRPSVTRDRYTRVYRNRRNRERPTSIAELIAAQVARMTGDDESASPAA